MKKIYLTPSIIVVKQESRQMQYTSVEQTYAPVDTSTSSDASEAMSRGSHGFSLWDDE